MAEIDNLSIRVTATAEEAARALDRLASSAGRLRGAARGATGGMQDMVGAARDAGTAIQEAGSQSERLGSDIRRAGTNARSGASGVSSFWMALRNVGKFGATAFKAISFLPKTFGKEFIGNLKDAGAKVGFLFGQIKRVAMYRLIRTAIKLVTQEITEGVKRLYDWSKTADHTFANSMDRIATAAQYMGNSFAAMVSPLINALSPAIDFIADKFVDLFNLINQIFSRLAGQTSYTAARKVAAQWQDASKDASDGAKKAADEIKRTILGFDEINKLNGTNDNNGGGGSGSGSGTSGSNIFETRPIEGAVSSFADQLKAAFNASDWQGLGELLGGKVNEIVENINFAGAGQKVGYYINAWFSTKYWTLETINFTNIGSKIAEFLNNMIGQIDFNVLGRLMVQKMTIIGDLVIGFFTDFDWGQAAGKLSDFVNGLYGQLTEWFGKYDWGDLGRELYNKLKDILANFDFDGVASSFMTLLGTAVRAWIHLGAGFIAGFWNDISNYWNENIQEDTFADTAKNILEKIGGVIVKVITGQWAYEKFIKPFVAALTGNDNWDSGLKQFGATALDKVKEGWNSVVTTARNVLQFFVDVKNDAKTWWSNVQGWWSGVVGNVEEFATNVKNRASTWWGSVQTWWHGVVGSVEDFATNVKDNAKTWWANVENWWGGVVGNVEEFATNVKNRASTWWGSVQAWWHGVVGSVDEFATNVKDDAKTWWANVQMWWNTEVKGKAVDVFVKIGTAISELWTWLTGKWSTDVNGDPSKMLAIRTFISTTAAELWESVKKGWDDLMAKIGGFLEIKVLPVLSDIGDGVLEGGKWIKEKATDVWNWLFPGAKAEEAEFPVKIVPQYGAGFNVQGNTVSMAIGPSTASVVAQFGSGFTTSGTRNVLSLGATPATVNASYADGFVTSNGVPRLILNSQSVTVNAAAGDGLTGGGKTGFTANIGKTASVSINGTPGAGFSGKLSGTNTYTLKGIEDASVGVDATPGTGFSSYGGNGKLSLTGINNASAKVDVGLTSTSNTDAIQALKSGTATKKVNINLDVSNSSSGGFGLLDDGGTQASVDALNTLLSLFSKLNATTTKKLKLALSGSGTISSPLKKALTLKDGDNKTMNFNVKDGKVDPLAQDAVEFKSGTTKNVNVGMKVASGYDAPAANVFATTKTKIGKTVEVAIQKAGSSIDWLVTLIKSLLPKKADGGVLSNGTWSSISQKVFGGIFSSGIWSKIPQYAGGTLNAHGSLFLAGEAGPEIVGHVGGRTEVLNKSQLAATMYSAVRSAMSGVTLDANFYSGSDDEADYDTMYRAMYDAFSAVMARGEERDREKVALLRQINAKDTTVEISTSNINRSQTRANRRAGVTIVPVGT